MVTIKIQSANDIIKAYLRALNYSNKQSEQISLFIAENIKDKLKNNDVIDIMDNILLEKAKIIFDKKNIQNVHLVAMLKFSIITANLKDNCKESLFMSDDLDEDLIKELCKNVPDAAPDYKISKMEAQKIEPMNPKNILRKIAGIFK